MQGKEKCAGNFWNFNPVDLIAEIILELSFLCHFMGLVGISGHVRGFFNFCPEDAKINFAKHRLNCV